MVTIFDTQLNDMTTVPILETLLGYKSEVICATLTQLPVVTFSNKQIKSVYLFIK
jgi:hypothetical protein